MTIMIIVILSDIGSVFMCFLYNTCPISVVGDLLVVVVQIEWVLCMFLVLLSNNFHLL